MICLTGDIHHASLRTGNQRHCDISEIRVAQRFLRLLVDANVQVTFFITGRAFEQEWHDLEPICRHPLVEVAGHTYYCFKPEFWHRVSNKLLRSYNGPPCYQRWDIAKTVKIIEAKCGRRITCWRNHMYMHGPYTEMCLKACDVPVCSDGVKKNSTGPELHPSGIFNFPINVMPDHEHLYHAERTPEWVKRWVNRYNWSDDYGSASYHIEEWTDRVLQELREHEEAGIVSNMLIHPITMYLCDKFKSLERILEYLSERQTAHMQDIYRAELAKRETPSPR